MFFTFDNVTLNSNQIIRIYLNPDEPNILVIIMNDGTKIWEVFESELEADIRRCGLISKFNNSK